MASNPPDIWGLFIWRIPASNSRIFGVLPAKLGNKFLSCCSSCMTGSLNYRGLLGWAVSPWRWGGPLARSDVRIPMSRGWSFQSGHALGSVTLHPALQVTPAHMSCACCLWFLLIFAECTLCISYHKLYVYIIYIYTWLLCSIYFYIVNIYVYIYNISIDTISILYTLAIKNHIYNIHRKSHISWWFCKATWDCRARSLSQIVVRLGPQTPAIGHWPCMIYEYIYTHIHIYIIHTYLNIYIYIHT